MTDTESKWAARIKAWKDSGQTARDYCNGKGFSVASLRIWRTRLRKLEASQSGARVRLARVLPAHRDTSETPILIEIAGARLGVRRGFDSETLRAVIAALGGPQ